MKLSSIAEQIQNNDNINYMRKTQHKDRALLYIRFRFAAELLVIVAATLAAYIPAMQATYVWDDNEYVTDNPLIVDSDGLYRIWFSQDSPSQYFPMVFTSFRLEYNLWGFNPLGYHITNIALHIINAILLWLLLWYLSIPAAWLIAAIFALHPVQVESVAWITERKNLLMTFFFFLSLLAYLRFVNLSNKSQHAWPLYIVSLVLYAAALLSKTTACTAPVVLVLLLWFKNILLDRNRWLQIIPYVVLGLAMGLLTLWWELQHQGTARLKLGIGMLDRILLASRAIWFYLVKLAWPANLTFSYPKWQLNPSEPLQYLWVLACVVVGFCLWYWRKQVGRGSIVAVLFFVATLFPTLGIFPLYTFRYTYVADHYQYVASIGPIALVCAAGYYLTKHCGWLRIFLIIIIGSALTALSFLTWRQSHEYKNEKTLWEDTLRKNPQSFMAYNNLGAILCSEGKFDTAITYFRKAIQIYPEYFEGYNNLAYALATLPSIKKSDPNESIRLAKRAIELQKHPDLNTLDTLAAAYASTGQFEKAVTTARTALILAYVANDKKLAKEIKMRLELYKQGKPYQVSVDGK
jgi:hypothetical protein